MLSRPASRALSRPHALRNSSSILLRVPSSNPTRRPGAEFLRACSSQPSSSAEPDGVIDSRALRMVALQASIPFVGFGFMDNFVMILVGDQIDLTLGVAFGFSTMAAAALGNTFSDALGVWAGGLIDRVAEWFGIPPHGLSQAQLKLPRPRLASQLGQAAGVIFGCIVGMFPLLLLDTEKATKLKQSSSQEALFKAIVHECSALLHAESATLWMVDRSGAGANVGAFAVWGRTEEERDVSVPTHSAPAVGYVVRSGAGVSVGDVATHPLFRGADGAAAVSDAAAAGVKSMLCFPVFAPDGSVSAVLQVVNKQARGGGVGAFARSDEKFALKLCSHVSVFIENSKRVEEGMDWVETMRMVRKEADATTLITTPSEFEKFDHERRMSGMPPPGGLVDDPKVAAAELADAPRRPLRQTSSEKSALRRHATTETGD